MAASVSVVSCFAVFSEGQDLAVYFTAALHLLETYNITSTLAAHDVTPSLPNATGLTLSALDTALDARWPRIRAKWICVGNVLVEVRVALIGAGGGLVANPVSAGWYSEFVDASTVWKKTTVPSKTIKAVRYEEMVDFIRQYEDKFEKWEKRRDRREKAMAQWVPPPPPPPPSPPLPINDEEMDNLLENVLTAAYEDHQRRQAAGGGRESRKRRRTSGGDDLAAEDIGEDYGSKK
ncbi:hypothetical protein BDK51DRAFT_43650 [Blyttiomyces helicus]|uniref:Uncharacterized protein n=1 Tax=Blyttiomyces helicus TaxID=388810 RepID=A0A4P9VYL6_9FUNG|nr:hypothetical protein BDK51DRAFT_43650 [Blyttiomyces helicus]|eukprot:RKO82886.1 hypothetical protein BDK51DRAFT_43650 [Blyttiomyces helicus]